MLSTHIINLQQNQEKDTKDITELREALDTLMAELTLLRNDFYLYKLGQERQFKNSINDLN